MTKLNLKIKPTKHYLQNLLLGSVASIYSSRKKKEFFIFLE